MDRVERIVAKVKDRPPTEMGSWVLDGLTDPQPTTEIVGRREARMDSFLARDGLRKTIKHRKRLKEQRRQVKSGSASREQQ